MIWMAMGLIIVGATLQTSSFTLAHLIVGRIITGQQLRTFAFTFF
jgi:hypothetical protein